MAYRDKEVGTAAAAAAAGDVGAADVSEPVAMPGWRLLHEQTLKRAETAEAHAEELRWAEVAARTEAASWKSLHETVRLYDGTRKLCDQQDRIRSLYDDVGRQRHGLKTAEAAKARLLRAAEAARARSPAVAG